MKYFFLAFAGAIILVVILAGPRDRHSPNRPLEFFPDMVRQSKVKPQSPSAFFADQVGPRLPVGGTVPMGYHIPHDTVPPLTQVAHADQTGIVEHPTYEYTQAPDYYNTGKMGDKWGTGIPLEVTPDLLAKGQERFTINCQVCHGGTGGGNGVTSKYGLNGIANYHEDKYLQMSDGQIFNTITNGYQSMMGYGANIAIRDRWAIVCYIRALQKSQLVKLEELPADQAEKIRDSK